MLYIRVLLSALGLYGRFHSLGQELIVSSLLYGVRSLSIHTVVAPVVWLDMHSFLAQFSLLVLFAELSSQKDPVNDICRRFGHQSAVIDRKLYIDGGFVNWNTIAANPLNYTSKQAFFISILHFSTNLHHTFYDT